jgi:hypothetical protein
MEAGRVGNEGETHEAFVCASPQEEVVCCAADELEQRKARQTDFMACKSTSGSPGRGGGGRGETELRSYRMPVRLDWGPAGEQLVSPRRKALPLIIGRAGTKAGDGPWIAWPNAKRTEEAWLHWQKQQGAWHCKHGKK